MLLSMNSTTTDWMRTSINAAVPLKQADSICLDLEDSQEQHNLFHSSAPLRRDPVHRHRNATWGLGRFGAPFDGSRGAVHVE